MTNCPFLGLEEDPQTLSVFPSEHNFCYRTEKPTPIELAYQQEYCLIKNHLNCPVFQDISHLTLPIASRQVVPPPVPRPLVLRGVWAALAVFFLAGSLAALGWFFRSGLFVSQPAEPTRTIPLTAMPVTATLPPLVVQPLPTPTLGIASILNPPVLPTTIPTATATSTPLPVTSIPLGLETPVGTAPRLLVHRIQPGENLDKLAVRYGTSSAAIRSVNYFLPVPLWEGVMVVIPIKTTDVSGLPAFEPYQVKDGSKTLEDVAWLQNTSPELVSRYNQMDPAVILSAGGWILIPRPSPPPTGLPLATLEGKIQTGEK